jgi:polyribonucleotide nucleotidyltransferase
MIVNAIIELGKCARISVGAPAGTGGSCRARLHAYAESDLMIAYQETRRRARTRLPPCGWRRSRLPATSTRLNCWRLFKDLESKVMRRAALETGWRIDGRDTKTVRLIVSGGGRAGAHACSALSPGAKPVFLSSPHWHRRDEQIIDALEGEFREHFMPTTTSRPTKARFGAWAARAPGDRPRQACLAIHPSASLKSRTSLTPARVSEITESNGSSSMATVCGSLALMDAGVPLNAPAPLPWASQGR